MVRFLAPATNKDDIREECRPIALVVLGAGLAVSFFLLLFEQSIAANLLGNNRTVALLLSLIPFVASYNVVLQTHFRHFNRRNDIDCLVAFGHALRCTRRSVRSV
jgi:hypothetical protein